MFGFAARRQCGFSRMAASPSIVKTGLLHGVVPALMGILAAWLIPWPAAPATALTAGTAPGSLPSTPTPALSAPALPASASPAAAAGTTSPGQDLSGTRPADIIEWIALLGDARRVEDLLVEVEKLPPGKGRNNGIWRLMKEWLPMNRAAAMEWMARLEDPAEKTAALTGMVESWGKEDMHAASAFLAALPDGPMKRTAGRRLAHGLALRDPASSLSWSLASRNPDESLGEEIQNAVTFLASRDYESADRLISGSELSAIEKQQMKEKARISWNAHQVRAGKWELILPEQEDSP